MRRTAKLILMALAALAGVAAVSAALLTWGPYLTPKDAPVPNLEHARVFGDRDGSGRLEQPIGIAVSAAGDVFVSDSGNQRIAVFSAEGTFLRGFGRAGSGAGELDRPMHLGFAPDGLLYVAEYLNDRISVFEPNGAFVRHIEPPGVDAPGGVAVGPNGALYVPDFYNHRVLVRESSDDSGWRDWGTPGRVRAGSIHYPTDVDLAPDGSLWVADAYNNRIQRFDDGESIEIAGWGLFGRAFGFQVADGLGVDGEGRVWAVDFYGGQIRVFDPDGTPLLTFAEPGTEAGQLRHPTDVAIADGRVYVADFGNNRVQVWRMQEGG